MVLSIWRSFVLAVALIAVAACDNGVVPDASEERPSSLIAQGRTGGPLPNEECTWTLLSVGATQGVLLEHVESGGEGGATVRPEGVDDVVWVHMSTFCADAPTFVFGGVSEDVGSVVLTSENQQEVVLEVLDVPGRSWGAVIGELPRSWRSDSSFVVEAISRHDGAVLVRESSSI